MVRDEETFLEMYNANVKLPKAGVQILLLDNEDIKKNLRMSSVQKEKDLRSRHDTELVLAEGCLQYNTSWWTVSVKSEK